MAWTYLAELPESRLPLASGSSLSPIVKSTLIAGPFCLAEWLKENYPSHLSGMTSKLCKEACSPQSISSMADFPARTSALQAMARAWQESEAAYFLRSRDSLAKLDRVLSSWKMCLPFASVAPTLLPDDWPASGMIVDGECFPLLTWERRTSENDGGYWPTATATLFPTPTAATYGTCNNEKRGDRTTFNPSLETMARQNLWPTATTRDTVRSEKFRAGRSLSPREQTGGRLNPMWVEWLMGYPSGWTVCADWAMPLSPRKRAKRSKG